MVDSHHFEDIGSCMSRLQKSKAGRFLRHCVVVDPNCNPKMFMDNFPAFASSTVFNYYFAQGLCVLHCVMFFCNSTVFIRGYSRVTHVKFLVL